MNRYVCIHGHFYQPPRENPWLEDVELQDSAYPYHDWNERITEECYRQNAASRILSRDKKIVDIVNNYSRISFDFGPTLMSWLKTNSPEVYQAVIEADKQSQQIFSGHGAAIAQAYNHMIMPLANLKDKKTQTIWGIEDFKFHFKRPPEGMWLPETAVDIETLEVLAENGITFTILAPRQAARIRKLKAKSWTDVNEQTVDTTRPYICKLPSGRSINIFFYLHSVSRDVAYGPLLHSGRDLAQKLIEPLEQNPKKPQMVHIATDGETYGHHHRRGDMALAYCLHHIQSNQLAQITIYGEFLEKSPPEYEVEIHENTSWSCDHGIERWRLDCGCVQDYHNRGKQQWRAPLREALNFLREKTVNIYQKKMKNYASDPWAVRDRYISVINDRDIENVERFISSAVKKPLDENNKIIFLKLLELQRNAMLMFTSCGWFFDNLTGIETVQLMLYASRTIQLAKELGVKDYETQFRAILEKAPANHPLYANGSEVYKKLAKPGSIDLNRVGAHLAVSSIFGQYPEDTDVFCYRTKIERYESMDAGIQRLAVGRAMIQSKIILEEDVIDFAVLHFGDHNLICSVSGRMPDKKFEEMFDSIKHAFRNGDTTEVMRIMNLSFEPRSYSLWTLFKDEQRRIINELLATTRQEIEASFRHIYEYNYTIIQMMRSMKIPLPKPLAAAAEFTLNHDLCEEIAKVEININRLQALTEEVTRLSLHIDEPRIRYNASRKINDLMLKFEQHPEDVDIIETVENSINIVSHIVPELDLDKAQNIFFVISRKMYPEMLKKSEARDDAAIHWIECFDKLAHALGVALQ